MTFDPFGEVASLQGRISGLGECPKGNPGDLVDLANHLRALADRTRAAGDFITPPLGFVGPAGQRCRLSITNIGQGVDGVVAALKSAATSANHDATKLAGEQANWHRLSKSLHSQLEAAQAKASNPLVP
jgi:hypothetical protein